MKKQLLLILFVLSGFYISAYACHKMILNKGMDNKTNIVQEEAVDFEILPTTDSSSSAKNQVWVGTFQLVWNDLIDEIIKQPVEFVGKKSITAEELNRKSFTTDELSDSAYYKKWGLMSPYIKKEIEKGIKEKFDEKSDILDSLDWTPAPKKYILYAMLKKDFEFVEKFAKLDKAAFVGSDSEVEYFGTDKDSSYALKRTVNVLFYNSEKDYAVALSSKQGDLVYLYRTDDDKTLKEYYNDMLTKGKRYSGNKIFGENDKFKAPMLDFKSERSFDELCGKPIKNSDMELAQAIETIQFKMDEAGVKLKSEAVITTKLTCVAPSVEKPRYFYFNDKYVIFIAEQGKKPYFAAKISDAAKLQK